MTFHILFVTTIELTITVLIFKGLGALAADFTEIFPKTLFTYILWLPFISLGAIAACWWVMDVMFKYHMDIISQLPSIIPNLSPTP